MRNGFWICVRGSALGFEKAADLREVFGDAIWQLGILRRSESHGPRPNDADQHAWYLTRKAELELIGRQHAPGRGTR